MPDHVSFLTLFSIVLQVFSLSIGLYYLFVGLCGFLPIKEKHKKISDKLHRYALIISAHNEEAVIANMVESLNRLKYPREMYDIFVIADNCTDKTAECARKAGAIVYERHDSSKRGKGFALEWMFEKIYNMDTKYDYVSIFDADNLVDENFLAAMNDKANRGFRVVQGFLDSKNPYDSWISASYSFCFWSINRIFQLARYKTGLCCELSGTGFIIAVDTLKKLGWGATCLTEDMEFTMKLCLNDEKVAFAYDAKVYDEKPLTLKQSWRQRVRWMQGHCDVASRYFWKLIKKGIKERKLSCIDCATYLVQPIRIIALGIITFFAYAQTFHPDGDLGFVQIGYLFDNSWIWSVICILQMLYMPFVVIYERREFKWIMIPYYFAYMVYNFTWMPIAIQGMIGKNNTEWSHTEHTRTISMDELKHLKKSRI
ncbi:MAG: glycosyltransferase family 2 protein [Clostridiales bacterium]|nr:glycosyltransferase family 2 protein [Clostridiales bacterium]